MSTETHINSIKAEYVEAVADAHAAIDNAVQKFDNFVNKLVADNPQLQQAPVAPQPAVPETVEPPAKPEVPVEPTPPSIPTPPAAPPKK